MRWRQGRTWTCILHQSWKTCACSCLLNYLPLWEYNKWKRKPLAFSPLLYSLYAPLAPFIKRCSSFVATRKHAERGLAYNRASFSRVTASTMLSATLLHVYCSKFSKIILHGRAAASLSASLWFVPWLFGTRLYRPFDWFRSPVSLRVASRQLSRRKWKTRQRMLSSVMYLESLALIIACFISALE